MIISNGQKVLLINLSLKILLIGKGEYLIKFFFCYHIKILAFHSNEYNNLSIKLKANIASTGDKSIIKPEKTLSNNLLKGDKIGSVKNLKIPRTSLKLPIGKNERTTSAIIAYLIS